jgi:hypothetical protein
MYPIRYIIVFDMTNKLNIIKINYSWSELKLNKRYNNYF